MESSNKHAGVDSDLEGKISALEQRNAQLERKNADLEMYAAEVDHELKSKLNAVVGYVGLLQDMYNSLSDEKRKEFLEKIESNTHELLERLEDIQTISRIVYGKTQTQMVNLSSLANELAKELKARDKNRQIDFHIAPDMIVSGYDKALQVVLRNLFSNAYRYTKKDDSDYIAHIEFGAEQQKSGTAYFVRDNGVGISSCDTSKLFKPYTQLSGSSNKGSGFGLIIVKRIVEELHGGRIWAEGKEGEGATFYFTLNEKKPQS